MRVLQPRLLLSAALLLAAATSCADRAQPAGEASAKPSFPEARDRMWHKADIQVLTATTLVFEGQRCQLLGVAESDDPIIREQGRLFAQRWIEATGGYASAANDSHPLFQPDDTPVVWIDAFGLNKVTFLNIQLVQAGLVEVDYEPWKDYYFTHDTKEDVEITDWRGELDEAKRAHERGEMPEVHFDWPPQ